MASLIDCNQFKEELKSLLLEGYSIEDDFCELYEYFSSLENPRSVLEHVRVFKEEGNWLFKKGELDDALEKYGLGGICLTTAIVENKNDMDSFNDLACSIALNMAACLLKKKEFMQVGKLCSIVLTYNPDNVKAHYRRAIAAMELNRNDLAFWDLKLALGIEPLNSDVGKLFTKVKHLLHSPSQDHVQEPIGLGPGVFLPKKVSNNKSLKDGGGQNEIKSKDSCLKNGVVKDSEFVEKEVIDEKMENLNVGMPLMEEDASSIVDMNNNSSTEILASEPSKEGMNLNTTSMEVEHVNVEEKEDLSRSETGSNHENEDMMDDELSQFKEDFSRYGGHGNASLYMKEKSDGRDLKYRFYNRRGRGSTITISKDDYLLLAQGKTLKFYNSRTCSVLQVKVSGVQSQSQREVSTSSCVTYSNGGNQDDDFVQMAKNISSLDKPSDISSATSSLTSTGVDEEDKKEFISTNCGGEVVPRDRSLEGYFRFASVREKVSKRKFSMDLQSNLKKPKSNRQIYGAKSRFPWPCNGAVPVSTYPDSNAKFDRAVKRKCACSTNFNLCNFLTKSPRKRVRTSIDSSFNVCTNVNLYDDDPLGSSLG